MGTLTPDWMLMQSLVEAGLQVASWVGLSQALAWLLRPGPGGVCECSSRC